MFFVKTLKRTILNNHILVATTHYTTKPTPTFTPLSPCLISGECMNCLCQTMSHCVVDDKCTGAACGPFRINREYWAASGKPVIHYGVCDIDNEYNKCVKNWGCSVRSVLGYLSRFQQVKIRADFRKYCSFIISTGL